MSAAEQKPPGGAPGASSNACPACGAEDVRLKNVDGMLICDKCASKKFSSKVRASIQDAFNKQQENMRRDAYNRRLIITKNAYALLSKGKQVEAIQQYEKYLEVLNNRFKTTTATLHPHLFDSKKDAQELLLVTAVMWDLARTLDKMKGRDNEFRLYLKKYVEFSMGAKHMILSAETLRKYVKDGKGTHGKDFENAHTALRTRMPRCFVSTAVYGPYAPETVLLQIFRDEWLTARRWGLRAIKLYYRVSPPLAAAMARSLLLNRTARGALGVVAVPLAKHLLKSKLRRRR